MTLKECAMKCKVLLNVLNERGRKGGTSYWDTGESIVRERENGVKASSRCTALRFLSRLLECPGAEATCWVSFHLPEAALLWCPCLAKPCTRNGPWEAQQLFLAC